MKRIKRDRHLTPDEAAKYNSIRDEIDQEKSAVSDRIRKRIADKRRAAATRAGTKTLGQQIRAARERHGQSQDSVAAAAGISQGYLSQLETDEREPTLSIAARLAQALGITLDEMASGAV